MILLAGCVTGPGSAELPPADSASFEAEVEPELGASCGLSSCHGTPRPLEVYTPFYNRLDPADLDASTPLTAEEHRLNFDRARAFLVPEDPEASLLLRKPLPPAAGGVPHGEDLVIYLDDTDERWLVLATWAGAR